MEVAVPKNPVPLAVKLVVEAPPFMEKRPLVIVEEALERKPLIRVVRPLMLKEPNDAVWEKRFVELAVVEKMLVEVALARVVFPVIPRVPATARLPEESIVVVALPPKYAGPNELKSVVDAAPSVVRPPLTASVPPTVTFPLVRNVPALVFRVPTPSPPVRYCDPTIPRFVEGEVVPMPIFPLPCCTTNCEEPTVKPWPLATVVVPLVFVNCPRPKYPVPLAVMLVVEAPPFMEKRPLVIVEEALERKPLIRVVRPLMLKEPNDAVWEKRFVELAVVEKMLVEVALPSDVFPVAEISPVYDEPVIVAPEIATLLN